jgi:hypothetical protein
VRYSLVNQVIEEIKATNYSLSYLSKLKRLSLVIEIFLYKVLFAGLYSACLSKAQVVLVL